MNKKQSVFQVVTIALLGVLLLSACGTGAASKDDITTLKVSTVSVPHAEILEEIASDLEQDGVKLDLSILSDGIQANQQTAKTRCRRIMNSYAKNFHR